MLCFSVPPGYRRTAPCSTPDSWTGSLRSSSLVADGGSASGCASSATRPKRIFGPATRRARVQRRLHDREGLCARSSPIPAAGDVRAADPSNPAMGRRELRRKHRAPIGGVSTQGRTSSSSICRTATPAIAQRAYPAATAEAWIDGHVHAFAFFGGVPTIESRRQRPLSGVAHSGGRDAQAGAALRRLPERITTCAIVLYGCARARGTTWGLCTLLDIWSGTPYILSIGRETLMHGEESSRPKPTAKASPWSSSWICSRL